MDPHLSLFLVVVREQAIERRVGSELVKFLEAELVEGVVNGENFVMVSLRAKALKKFFGIDKAGVNFRKRLSRDSFLLVFRSQDLHLEEVRSYTFVVELIVFFVFLRLELRAGVEFLQVEFAHVT